MTRFLLILIGISVGAYRIDMAYGKAGFLVTPILLCSVVFTLYYTAKITFTKIRFPEKLPILLFLVFALICWIPLNLDFDDDIQVKRMILFDFLIITGIALNLAFYNDPNPRKTYVIFCYLSIIVFVLFTILQYALFFNDTFYTSFDKEASIIELRPLSVGESFPRITGGFWDPNVAGYFLIFIYLTLSMLEFESNRFLLLKTTIVILVITTLSRTSLVVMCLVVIIDLFRSTKFISVFTLKRALKIILLFNLFIFSILTFSYFLAIGKFETIINNRLTTNDRSATIHFALMDLGMEKVTNNFENFLIGYGFGSSYIFTSYFTGGSKYGNFHSEFLTFQIETGIIGLLLYLSLIFTPLFWNKIFKDQYNFFLFLIAVTTILEGIFYQQYLFQYYWLFLLIPWFWQNEEFKLKMTSISQ